MIASIRRLMLTTHVTLAVGLLGSIAAFLCLAIAGLTSEDGQIVRAAYLAMDLMARFVIVPLAFAALLTGVVESLSTPWGLLRHYWVVAKLALTVFASIILLAKLELIATAAHLATQAMLPRAELRGVGLELVFHAAAGLLVLLVPVILSVYKPRGVTSYGVRVMRRPMQRVPGRDFDREPVREETRSPGAWVTITLRPAQIVGLVLVVLMAHVAILHVAGIAPHVN